MRLLFCLSASLFFAHSGFTSAPVDSKVLKYGENGNWVVQVLRVDAEGFPDTLERSVFPTEPMADRRFKAVRKSLGITEPVDFSEDRPLRELRNPLAGEIWTATEAWSPEWEMRYSEWVRNEFDYRFFSRYKVETDCADVAIAVRWIFSRIFHLPAGNRLSSGGALLTNRSVRSAWKNLPTADNWYDDRRFRAALDYVLVNTYTHSINADSYPILIDFDWIKEGAFHLELRDEDGHTRLFTRVTRARGWPITDMWSTVPKKVRPLVVEPFTVFVQPPLRFGGILRHRWVRLGEDSAWLVPEAEMPGYSLEQYSPDFFKHGRKDFSAEIVARIDDSLDPLVGLQAIITNLRRSFSERKDVVNDGFKECQKEDCSPGSVGYENWSTPSRDKRIGEHFQQVAAATEILRGDDRERSDALMKNVRRKKIVRVEGEKLQYDDLARIWAERRYSSDPRDPPGKRWGL